MRRASAILALSTALVVAGSAFAQQASLQLDANGLLRGTLAPAPVVTASIPSNTNAPLRGALKNDDEKPGVDRTETGAVEPLRGAIVVAGPGGEVAGLRGTVETALNSSDRLRASLHDANAAQFGVWRELAAFTPVITGSVSQSYDDGMYNSDGDNRYATLNLSMPLFTSGQRWFDVAAARSSARAAAWQAATVRDGVALNTAEAYMQQVYAAIAAKAVGRNETTIRRLLASMRAQHDRGFASGADVAEVDAELKDIEQQLVDLDSMEEKAALKLRSLAGRQVTVTGEFPAIGRYLTQGRARLLAAAMRFNPNVLAAASNADASQSASRAVIARHLPQVGLNSEYRRILDNVSDGGERDRWNVGVKLTVPLVDLSTVASIGESRQRAAAERYRAADTRRTIAEQFEALWEEYEAGREKEQLARAQIAARAKVAASSEARFSKGLIGLDLLLDNQRKLMSAEVDLAQIRVQNTLAGIQILVISGVFKPHMLAS